MSADRDVETCRLEALAELDILDTPRELAICDLPGFHDRLQARHDARRHEISVRHGHFPPLLSIELRYPSHHGTTAPAISTIIASARYKARRSCPLLDRHGS